MIILVKIKKHLSSLKQLKKINNFGRMNMINGNHDIEKKSPVILEKYFYKYYDKITKQSETLLEGLVVEELLVLNYKDHEAGNIAKNANVDKLLLTHFWPSIDKQKYVDGARENFTTTKAAEEGKKLILRRN